MTWLHDVSQAALAVAVMTLGVVILLELRSVLRLRHAVDSNLARIFEQLDLLRFENQELIEACAQARPRAVATRPAAGPEGTGAGVTVAVAASNSAASAQAVSHALSSAGGVYQNAAALAASGVPAREIADRCGLASGEARLLSSLAQARARRAASAGTPST